eukprot:545599_1
MSYYQAILNIFRCLCRILWLGCDKKQNRNKSSATKTKSIYVSNSTTPCKPKYSENDPVRVCIPGCNTWLESIVVEVMGNEKYLICINEYGSSKYQQYIQDNHFRVVHEYQIKKCSKRTSKITANSSIKRSIVDLYLNGGKCRRYVKPLTNSILRLCNRVNNQMDYSQSRFIALQILSYCFEETFHWRIYCFWCNAEAPMYRCRCRAHVIAASGANIEGAPANGNLSLIVFCDECDTELEYDDYSYRCTNKQHDICLECLWNKIKEYKKIKRSLQRSLGKQLNIDVIECVTQYVVGDMRKFTSESKGNTKRSKKTMTCDI